MHYATTPEKSPVSRESILIKVIKQVTFCCSVAKISQSGWQSVVVEVRTSRAVRQFSALTVLCSYEYTIHYTVQCTSRIKGVHEQEIELTMWQSLCH